MKSTLVCQSAFVLMLTLKALSASLPESSDPPPIYLHPNMFEDNYCNVTPKDVGAFKFYCILDHVSSILEEYAYIFAVGDEASYHFNITNATAICKKYADIKIYQVMLYKFFDSQATANISNTTILSIVYMLQQAGESLQEIQYDNHQMYCPDYDEEIQSIAANKTYRIERLLKTLHEDNYNWSQSTNYPTLFNSSAHIQYRNGRQCQHYMSLYTTLIMTIH